MIHGSDCWSEVKCVFDSPRSSHQLRPSTRPVRERAPGRSEGSEPEDGGVRRPEPIPTEGPVGTSRVVNGSRL